jgi:Protein of unknown function (DUF2802)
VFGYNKCQSVIAEAKVEQIVITWRELLIVVAIVLALYVAELIWFMGLSKKSRLLGKSTDQTADLIALKTELAELQTQFDNLQKTLEQLRNSQYAHPRYGQAIQMAQQGLDPPQVADGCDISMSEAELIVALYRART